MATVPTLLPNVVQRKNAPKTTDMRTNTLVVNLGANNDDRTWHSWREPAVLRNTIKSSVLWGHAQHSGGSQQRAERTKMVSRGHGDSPRRRQVRYLPDASAVRTDSVSIVVGRPEQAHRSNRFAFQCLFCFSSLAWFKLNRPQQRYVWHVQIRSFLARSFDPHF